MIRWTCRQCGAALDAPESMAGDLLECNCCLALGRVPGQVQPDPRGRGVDRPVSRVLKRVIIALWIILSATLVVGAIVRHGDPDALAAFALGWCGLSVVLGILYLMTCVRGVA